MRNTFASLLAFSFSLTALLGLAACGGSPEETDAAQGDAPVATRTVESSSARLEVPTEVPAGASFETAWTGPDGEDDYVTIVEAGAEQGTYQNYTYTREGSPLSLRAPDTPGAYEIRYVDGETKETHVGAPVTVTEVNARLQAPEEVQEGGTLDVEWNGPANEGDYLTIVEQGAERGTYLDYAYTKQGSPLSLTAPETAGPHEVRYVMDQSKRILARAPVRVTPASAELQAPDTMMIDTGVEINWTGPDNEDDYITVVEKGAPQGSYLAYTYTREGSPLVVNVPETPGRYELRYVMGQSKRILARAPLTVMPLSARLQAPADTTAGASLRIRWQGPNHPKDFIAIAREGAPSDAYESRALSRAGHPAALFAPSAPGTYEVRYVMAAEDSILATAPLHVRAGGSADQ